MSKKVIMIGGGGHAKSLAEILNQQGIEIHALVSPDIDLNYGFFQKIQHFDDDKVIFNFEYDEVVLVNGIGSIPGKSSLREEIFNKFKKSNYDFLSVKANFSLISKYCDIEAGAQVLSGTIINANSKIGENTIINSGAVIEHDCVIGRSNHIAPGVKLSGNVTTGSSVHIGTGATIIQDIYIGDNAIIGAGSVVTKDVPANHIVYPPRSTQSISPYRD